MGDSGVGWEATHEEREGVGLGQRWQALHRQVTGDSRAGESKTSGMSMESEKEREGGGWHT